MVIRGGGGLSASPGRAGRAGWGPAEASKGRTVIESGTLVYHQRTKLRSHMQPPPERERKRRKKGYLCLRGLH